jgi:chromate transporter
MTLIKLFLIFLKIGLMAVGGAYSFIPLLEKEIVDNNQWLTSEEFLDVLGMVKIFPGAISIKFATYTGYKVGGVPGVIVSNLGNLIGPIALVLLATTLYVRFKNSSRIEGAFKMIQLAVFSMIIAVALQMVDVNRLMNLSMPGILIIVISFLLLFLTKSHSMFVILGAGAVGALAIH